MECVRNGHDRTTAEKRRGLLALRFAGAVAALALTSAVACADTSPPDANAATPPTAPTATAATTSTRKVMRSPSPSDELNTELMHSTFLISGPAKEEPNHISFGTVFIMGVPYKDDPKIAHIVVVSAAHVFEGIDGDFATLLLRRRSAEGSYTAFDFQFPIRSKGKALYTRHPTADVAAMYGDIPDEVPMTGLSPESLVTDKALEDIEFHPGDEAYILGFPAAVSTEGGFPFLRTGRIASYPLTPMSVVKQWAFDAHVIKGNSGGLGLVIQEVHSRYPEFADRDLDDGVVVPAEFIKETLDMLPAPPDEAAK